MLGPNIEYQLKNKEGEDIPPHWINKVNKTSISMDHPPLAGDIVFFHSDVVMELGQEVLIYYYQDTSYKTHVALCSHSWSTSNINCILEKNYTHTSYIHTFTTAGFYDEEGFNYYYIIVFEGQKNVIHIYDFTRQKIVAEITYSGTYDAEITDISASNGFLYVVRRQAKTVDSYSLPKCV